MTACLIIQGIDGFLENMEVALRQYEKGHFTATFLHHSELFALNQTSRGCNEDARTQGKSFLSVQDDGFFLHISS